MSMTLIETKTLGTAAASIEFTSIPQDGTDLLVLASGRSSRSSALDGFYLTINGSTANQTNRYLEGTGSSVASGTETRFIGTLSGASSTSNTFANTVIYFSNYAGSTNKSFSVDSVAENNATTSGQHIIAGLWSQTAAITSLTFVPSVGPNFAIGSTISLYKITKGTDGIVTTS
jgi:hypothetical protein